MYVVVGLIIKGGDLHTLGQENVNHHRDRLPTDATNLYHGKNIVVSSSLSCTMPQAKVVNNMKTAIPILVKL